MTHQLKPGDRLVVASHNKGKVWEIKELLRPYGLDAISAADLNLPVPEETETTFEGNARLKAVAAAKASGLPALADDSGLEVAALSGAPGIYSARWAGASKDFARAMQKVADEIEKAGGWQAAVRDGKPGPDANFICVLCLAWPDGHADYYAGRVFGHLVDPPRGGNGFGYDPMFVPEGHEETFGEMEPAQKHAMSHRARAFDDFKAACLAHLPNAASKAPLASDAALEGLSAAAASLSTKDELATFVDSLRADLKTNAGNWENAKLEDFLESMAAWLRDSKSLPEQPQWRAVATALLAASRYE